MKMILSGILGAPVAFCAYAGLRYHYNLPSYIAAPATITAQVMSYVGATVFLGE